MPHSSGRSRRTRSRNTAISRSPAASADSTKPQAWRPIVSSATTGPSVKSAPLWIMLSAPKPSTTTHSHVTLRKNAQPSRRSAQVEVASARGGRGGIRTGTSSTAATAHVRASTASAQPGPAVTTMNAPSDGPITVRPLRVSDRSALACCSDSRGTSWGTMPAMAGIDIADTAPWKALSTMIIQSSARPVRTRTAMVPWERAEATLEICMTTARGKRSEITPPKSSSTIIGMVCAART